MPSVLLPLLYLQLQDLSWGLGFKVSALTLEVQELRGLKFKVSGPRVNLEVGTTTTRSLA